MNFDMMLRIDTRLTALEARVRLLENKVEFYRRLNAGETFSMAADEKEASQWGTV